MEKVADLHGVPEGAYNLRENGKSVARASSANIEIVSKTEEGKSGIDIFIKPGTKNESVHIPVILSQSGLHELVYNDFHIGEGADVLIIAGCGIHNCGVQDSEHSGVHTFYVGKNAKVRYVEKHYADGDGSGERIMNPTSEVYIEEGGSMEMETTQIKGVDSTNRKTVADLAAGSATRTPQDESKVTFAPLLSRTLSPIDWTKPAKAIHDQVRGLTPWPATSTDILNGETVKVFAVQETGESTQKAPGTVLSAGKDRKYYYRRGRAGRYGPAVPGDRNLGLPGRLGDENESK